MTITTILIVVLFFWRMSQGPEAVASSCASASCYRHSEYVRIVAVVIFELTFRDVQRHVFGADLMVAADTRPFEDRPEPFNRLRMYRADHVAVCGMQDPLMREEPPKAVSTTTAFSKASFVMISEGFTLLRTSSTIFMPDSLAMRSFAALAAKAVAQ